MTYTNDDNGDVLRRMEVQGDDLSRPRNIDFTVVFPEEGAAEHFAENFRRQGYRVSVEFAQTVKQLPWDVIVVKHMTPSHQEISALQEIAGTLGGRNDGWGCFSEPS